MSNIKPGAIPERLWQFLLSKAEIDGKKKCMDLGKKSQHKLTNILINDEYKAKGMAFAKNTSWEEEVEKVAKCIKTMLPI